MRIPSFKQLVESQNDRVALVIASIALLVISDLLFFFKSKDWQHEAKVIGTLKTDGMVRRRHARSLRWESVHGSTPVFLRDIVYTPNETTASIDLTSHKTLEMQPDSMIQFDEYDPSAVSVTLLSGRINGDALIQGSEKVDFKPYRGSRKLVAYLPRVEPFRLRYEELRDRITQHLIKKLPYRNVSPFEKAKYVVEQLSDFEIRLVSPAPGVKYVRPTDGRVLMAWTPIPLPDLNFQLELSRDNEFRSGSSFSAKRNYVSVAISGTGRYFWRVKARRRNEQRISRVESFDIATFRGKPERVLTYLGDGGAAIGEIFEVAVSKDRAFVHEIRVRFQKQPKCPTVSLPKGHYWCRVRTHKELLREYSFEVE